MEKKRAQAKKEAENLCKNHSDIENRKIVLFSQTTFSISMFEKIEKFLKEKFPQIEIVNSICPATHERQSSLIDLCSKVDGVLVIGGKTSANTNRLFTTAKKLCKNAYFIEKQGRIHR